MQQQQAHGTKCPVHNRRQSHSLGTRDLLARNVNLEQLQTAIDEYGGNHKSREIRMDQQTNGRQT